MKDPVVWYTINAIIDGLDPGSDSPAERLKFMVYQRRMLLAAMKEKAIMLSAVNGDAAQKLMKQYVDLMIPTDPDSQRLQDYRFEKTLDNLTSMGPVPLASFRFGTAVGPGDLDKGLS